MKPNDADHLQGDLRRRGGGGGSEAGGKPLLAGGLPRLAAGKRRGGGDFCVCGGDGSVGSQVSEWGK
jgi:hypothetical protein